MNQRPILFPTDFSECSLHALATASELAKNAGAKLLIAHIVETLGPENVTVGEAQSVLQPQGYLKRLQTDLGALRPTIAGVEVEYLLAEGDPPRQIVRLADERDCALIVMGTYGRTGLKSLFIGGTSRYVVQHAVCPVVTVKLPPSLATEPET